MHDMSDSDISEYLLIKKNVVWICFPTFLYISTPVISNYWYLKVNFLGPENLL